MLTNKRRHSHVVDVRSYRAAECDIVHYLPVVKVRLILSVIKRAALKFYAGNFNARKLNDLEVKEECQVKISNSFAAFENLMMMWTSVGRVKVLRI